MATIRRTEEEIKEIKQLRKKGVTCREISEKLGISKQRVSTLAKKDLSLMERDTKYSYLIDTFIKEYGEGYTVTEIAKKYNTVAPTVFRILKKKGININRKRNRRSASEVIA